MRSDRSQGLRAIKNKRRKARALKWRRGLRLRVPIETAGELLYRWVVWATGSVLKEFGTERNFRLFIK